MLKAILLELDGIAHKKIYILINMYIKEILET